MRHGIPETIELYYYFCTIYPNNTLIFKYIYTNITTNSLNGIFPMIFIDTFVKVS